MISIIYRIYLLFEGTGKDRVGSDGQNGPEQRVWR
jgi:hypothetical protein